MVLNDPSGHWETWREHSGDRTGTRMDLYLGRELRDRTKARASALGMTMTGYIKAVLLHFMLHYPADKDPRE